MKQAGPAGWIGLAHPSGWINADTFLESPKHFAACSDCNKHEPHLLLLYNHSSHLCLKFINFARDNVIMLLTFPTHFSHKHQPLDVSDYGEFKDALRTAFIILSVPSLQYRSQTRVLFRHEGSSYLKKLSLIHKLVRIECQQHLEEQLFERESSVAHQKNSLEQDLPRSNAKDSAPRHKQTRRTLSD